MIKSLLTGASVAAFALCSAFAAAQETPPPAPPRETAVPPAEAAAPAMRAEDMIRLNRLAAPAVSADGRTLAFQLTETGPAPDFARTTRLVMTDVTDAARRQIDVADLADSNESAPAFSPDGRRLYFLATSGGRSQLWFVELSPGTMTAGEPQRASDVRAGIDGFRLSPDGRRIAIWGAVAQDCPTFGCANERNLATPGPGSARVYDELFVRHWDAWETTGIHNRTFITGVGADGRLAGELVAAMPEVVGDSPTMPFGGGEEIAWGADSATLYVTRRLADRNEPRSTNLDIYAVSAATGQGRNLTDANDATDTLPAASPDGRWLAWAAMARPGYEADRQVLMLQDLRNGSVRALTEGWDRSVGSITWARDSRSLYVTAQDTLEHPAFEVDVRSGRVTRLTTRGTVNDVIALPRGDIIYTINSIVSPNDLVLRRANGATQRLTDVNAAALAARALVHYEQYSFAGAGGTRVWGQILTPMGARGPLPTVLIVHGGPQSSFGNGWSFRWNPALWAAQGYAVVTIDFHGSTGYGQAFTDSINRDWGGKPLEDLRLGFAAAAAANPAVDVTNACAAGASYGGYMINWMSGQWPDGFRCFINHAGIFDLRAMAFETEELWFDEWDHGGPWWSRPDAERWNPVNHVTSWRTPTLVTHGERDFRIPYSQSLAAFTALQRQGIESRLVIFPDENHWILRARNSLQWHQEVFGWLDAHLRQPAGRAGTQP